MQGRASRQFQLQGLEAAAGDWHHGVDPKAVAGGKGGCCKGAGHLVAVGDELRQGLRMFLLGLRLPIVPRRCPSTHAQTHRRTDAQTHRQGHILSEQAERGMGGRRGRGGEREGGRKGDCEDISSQRHKEEVASSPLRREGHTQAACSRLSFPRLYTTASGISIGESTRTATLPSATTHASRPSLPRKASAHASRPSLPRKEAARVRRGRGGRLGGMVGMEGVGGQDPSPGRLKFGAQPAAAPSPP